MSAVVEVKCDVFPCVVRLIKDNTLFDEAWFFNAGTFRFANVPSGTIRIRHIAEGMMETSTDVEVHPENGAVVYIATFPAPKFEKGKTG